MEKILLSVILCFSLTPNFAQSQKKITTYFLLQYNHTLYDETIGNNPWGAGIGLQSFYDNKSKFKPTIEITADAYLEDDKVQRLAEDGNQIDDDLGGMINVFVGCAYHLTRSTYLSLTAGPTFSNSRVLFGIKPVAGFYFSKTQKLTGKISLTNIFNREQITNYDFAALNLSVGIKLF